MSTSWKVVVILTAVLALGSVGAAGWFGYTWWRSAKGTSADAVEARDSALRAARQLAVTLQTVDPARPEDGLDAWQAAATGPLLDQLRRDRAKYLDQLKNSPGISAATVQGAVLTELDADAGSATAIAALDVTQSAPVNGRPAAPAVRQLRVKLTLSRTDAGWKVAGTGLVPA